MARAFVSVFEEAFKKTVGVEGAYADHPTDRGGKTMYGITERTAKAFGYSGDMKDLDLKMAKRIYQEQYWNHQRLECGDIEQWSKDVAMEVFDTAVNMGVITAAKMLQISLNALNYDYKTKEALFPELKIDGWVGQSSLKAMKLLDRSIDRRVVTKMMDCIQGVRYLAIMASDEDKRRLVSFINDVKSAESQRAFGRGWFEHRIQNVLSSTRKA